MDPTFMLIVYVYGYKYTYPKLVIDVFYFVLF